MNNRISRSERSDTRLGERDRFSAFRPRSREQSAAKASETTTSFGIKSLIKSKPEIAIGAAAAVGLLIGYFIKRK